MNFKGSPVNVVGSGTGRRINVNELAIACVRLTSSWVVSTLGGAGWGWNGIACGFSGFLGWVFWQSGEISKPFSFSQSSRPSRLLYSLTRAAATFTSLSACSCCNLVFSSSSFKLISASFCLISASICASLSFHSLSSLITFACCACSLCIAFACSCLAARSTSASARLLEDLEVAFEWLSNSCEITVSVFVFPKTDPYSFLFNAILTLSFSSWSLRTSAIFSSRLLVRSQISTVRVPHASILLTISGLEEWLRRIAS